VKLDLSRPGKPTDNAFIEALNGRFRSECLNAHWFMTLADAREKIEDRNSFYNECRTDGQTEIIGQADRIAADLKR
jgi:putative transposase